MAAGVVGGVVYASSVASAPVNEIDRNLRELYVQEYKVGDNIARYYLDIPQDSKPNQILRIQLGEREFNLKVPDYVRVGERVIVVAPN